MKLDKAKFLKRVIIACWVSLFVCFVIKICGGNFFVIMCDNERIIRICEFANTNKLLKYIIGMIYAIPSAYFYTLAVCNKEKYKTYELVVLMLTVSVSCFVKLFSGYLGLMVDFWQLIGMPMLFMKSIIKSWVRIPIGIALLLSFQLLSILTKNLSFNVMGDNVLVGAIFSIDVLIMLVLYYCYSIILRRKEK